MRNGSKAPADRLKEYSVLAMLCACCLAAGFYGFVDTGGAYPIEEKFERGILQGPLEPKAGPVVDFSQGVTITTGVDPINEYFSVVMALFIFGGILFAAFAALHDLEHRRLL
jgi:hypothetical protein